MLNPHESIDFRPFKSLTKNSTVASTTTPTARLELGQGHPLRLRGHDAEPDGDDGTLSFCRHVFEGDGPCFF